MGDNSKLVFYSADFCPYAQRTWLALLEKKVDFEMVDVNYFNKSLEETKKFMGVNPGGTVPAATHNGSNYTESTELNFYVEEAFPNQGTQLFPTDAPSRYRARMFLKELGAQTDKVFYGYLMCTDKEAALEKRKDLLSHLKKLDDHFQYKASPFILGENFSLCDIQILPFIERMDVLFPDLKEAIDWKEFPSLTKWKETCYARESMQIIRGPRTEQAIKTQTVSGAKDRDSFMKGIYVFYAKGKVSQAREVLKDKTTHITADEVSQILAN